MKSIQWTGDNFLSVHEFTGGQIELRLRTEDPRSVFIMLNQYEVILFQYIVEFTPGEFFTMTEQYHKLSQEILKNN